MEARIGSASDAATVPVTEYVAGDIEEYNTIVGGMFVPLIVSSRSDRFRARMRWAGYDDVFCLDLTAAAHVVQRTDDLIAATTAGDYYKVNLMLAGTSTIMQDAREAVLRTGDLAIYDTTRPYTLVTSEGARTAVLMFPRSLVTMPHEAVRELTATRFAGEAGLAPMVSAFLASVIDHLDEFATPSGHRIGQHIVDLVSTMLMGEIGQEELAAHRRSLMPRVYEYIEQRLADPGLSLTSIAEAHFVSTRHLQALFQRERTTVTAWIRERRLEMCRRDLADPYLWGESVATIAAKWGFAEPSHFSRAFKARFGCTPRSIRHRSEFAA